MATSSISSSAKSLSPSGNSNVLRRIFKALEYRDFRILWIGACTSSVGTWMQKLAQSWLVFQISNSAFYLGLDAFLGEIPIVLFSLIGGVVADRRERRQMLLMSQVIQMTCAFTLAVLWATGVVRQGAPNSVWFILTLSFFTGFAQAFGGPAYQALLPSLVNKEDVPNAIAMNSIQFNLARVFGPMLGGLALAKLGATWCFSLNGISFVAVVISLLIIRARYVPSPTNESMLNSLKQGFGFVRQQGAMVSLIALAFSMTVLGIPLLVFLPVFARNVFHGDADTYTMLLCFSGVGAIVGAMIVAYMGHFKRQGRAALVMLVVLGLLVAGFALSKNLALACALLFCGGAALMAVMATISSLVQLVTTDQMRGRVMSVYNVAFRGGMPVGSLVVGVLVPRFTAPIVLAVNGALLVVLGMYYLLGHRKIAEL